MKAYIQTTPHGHWLVVTQGVNLQLFVFQVFLFEFENFQGCKAEFSAECKDVMEKGLQKVGSVIVESGP